MFPPNIAETTVFMNSNEPPEILVQRLTFVAFVRKWVIPCASDPSFLTRLTDGSQHKLPQIKFNRNLIESPS